MKLEDLKEYFGRNVKVVLTNNKTFVGVFCMFERSGDSPNGKENITIEVEKGTLIDIYLDEIKSIDYDYSDQYEKGKFIMDFLENLGVDSINVAEAISDENYNRIYNLIIENPKITKDKFFELSGLEEEEEYINEDWSLVKRNNYLYVWSFAQELGIDAEIIEDYIDADNTDEIYDFVKKNPNATKEVFLKSIGYVRRD